MIFIIRAIIEMSSDPELQIRLVELETKVAFQDQTIETLNDVVTRLQTTIDKLTRELDTIKTQLRTVAPSLVVDQKDEKRPPHY